MSENKHKLFLLIAFIAIFIGIVVWLFVRQPADPTPRTTSDKVSEAFADLADKEPLFPGFLNTLPPFDELTGDHSTIPHGHASEDVGYSNIINPNWLTEEGCNLFGLNIFDTDCDGIPNWLEQFHSTNESDPEDPYHQGAWNYDQDRVIHGMDGHYSCDVYPTLLNCDQRVSSNSETIDHIQNTDSGCVPDVIEIVRGTNPLDGTDDHGPDIYGRRLSETQCSFGETTLNATALSQLPPVQEIDYTAPPLTNSVDFDIDDVALNISSLIDELNANIGNLSEYTDADFGGNTDFGGTTNFDDNPINDWTFTGAQAAFSSSLNLFNQHEEFINSISGFAEDGFHGAALANETFTVSAGGNTQTYMCESPGPMLIPYLWVPTPGIPQDISVTLSDEAGNTSGTTVVEDVTIDPDRWAVTIQRPSNTSRITTSSTAAFNVFFNKDVSTVGVDDFTVRTSGDLQANLTSVSFIGNGTYQVLIDQLEGEGMLGIDIALAHTITGPASEPSLNATYALSSRQTYLVDRVAPQAPDIVAPANGETIGNPSRVVVNCEDADDVIEVTAGTITETHVCQVPGLAFVPLPAITTTTPLDIEVIATDIAGQTSPVSLITNITFDSSIRPGVSFSRAAGASEITNDTTLEFDILFTQNMASVDMSDFTIVSTGSVTGVISSLVQVNPARYTITVTDITGDGLFSLFLTESHDITTLATAIDLNRGDTRAREMYKVDQTIPDPVAVVRPSSQGVASNPAGVMVYCQSGWESFNYDAVGFVQQELNFLASHAYDQLVQYGDTFLVETEDGTQVFDTDSFGLLEWHTRKNVKFVFDVSASTWSNGLAQIRGWVDTNGLVIRPELRYTDVTNVSYADEFQSYCNSQAFEQANFEDGQGWIWDILFMIFNAGSYKRSTVYAYFINPTTGALELDNVIQTPPGVQTPFVVSVPFDDPNIQGPPQIDQLLNPDGLYAFAIVDPDTHINLGDIVFNIPGIGDISIGIDFPIPDPTGMVASHIFTGPSCLNMFNRPTPVLYLDADQSTISGGYNRI